MKKHFVKILLAVGILLVLAAIVIAVINVINAPTVGLIGVSELDMSMMLLIFLSRKGVLSSYLALLGIGFVIASVVVKIIKRKGKNKPETH